MQNQNFNNKKIGILGLGVSGLACCEILLDYNCEIWGMDLKITNKSETIKSLENKGVNFILGKFDEKILVEMDLVVISPGIPLNLPPVVLIKSANIPLISEIELAYQLFPKINLIAVTGINGKTTTATLMGEILKTAKISSKVAGNIGYPLIKALKEASMNNIQFVVAEVSSFQLETIQNFKPRISIILNLGEDHLDRHKTIAEYTGAKANIFKNQTKDDLLILNYDDVLVRELFKQTKCKIFFFSTSRKKLAVDFSGIFLNKNKVILKINENEKVFCDVDDIYLSQKHNLENVFSCILAAKFLNIEDNKIKETLTNFKGLPHRQEKVAEVCGVKFVNDSKATNPHATLSALQEITTPLILIAGGKDKGMDFKELAEVIKEKVKFLVLLGECADKIAQEVLKIGFENFRYVSSMKEAVNIAFAESLPGDKVLLSPACSSLDMFKSFEQRGEEFKKYVSLLKENIKELNFNFQNCYD